MSTVRLIPERRRLEARPTGKRTYNARTRRWTVHVDYYLEGKRLREDDTVPMGTVEVDGEEFQTGLLVRDYRHLMASTLAHMKPRRLG